MIDTSLHSPSPGRSFLSLCSVDSLTQPPICICSIKFLYMKVQIIRYFTEQYGFTGEHYHTHYNARAFDPLTKDATAHSYNIINRTWLQDSNNCELWVFLELTIKRIAKWPWAHTTIMVWGWPSQLLDSQFGPTSLKQTTQSKPILWYDIS